MKNNLKQIGTLLVLLVTGTTNCGGKVEMVASTESDPDAGAPPKPLDYTGCSFESGDLTGFGHPGENWSQSAAGGMTVVVEQGADFSALLGEEQIAFTGKWAVLLRSNEQGDPKAYAEIVTDSFIPVADSFIIDQVSEVDGRGLELTLSILDSNGNTIEDLPFTVQTGGHLPGLKPEHEPFEQFPEITTESATPGSFFRKVVDLSTYYQTQQRIQIRIRQNTKISEAGFFTLLDNLCNLDPY